jgi:hypothetical protein
MTLLARTITKPRPATEPRVQPPAPPREPKVAKALRHHDGDDGYCHWLQYPNRTACGLRLEPPPPPAAIHYGQLGSCGRPPCPKCKQLKGG